MSSKSMDRFLEDPTPGNRIVVYVVIALVLVAGAIAFACCHGPESVQMIPAPAATATPQARSLAKGESSAQATGTNKTTIRIPIAAMKGSDNMAGPRPPLLQKEDGSLNKGHDQAEEIVIEVSQAIAAAATSSAQASASVELVSIPYKLPDHGRLGVIAATMPGILAADLQLVRLDVSPVTRWLVDVPLEVGVDLVGNLESGGLGVSVGSKAFGIAGAWSRWNLGDQGVALGAGLRF